MKKVLLVMLVALIAVSAVFAEFDKSKLNINVGQSMEGAYGVSYDFTDKVEAGVNVRTEASVPLAVYEAIKAPSLENLFGAVKPVGLGVFAEYKVAEFDNSDLKVGADAVFEVEGAPFPSLYANAVFSYHINENNSVFAKAVLPASILLEGIYSLVGDNLYYGAIGYSYNF